MILAGLGQAARNKDTVSLTAEADTPTVRRQSRLPMQTETLANQPQAQTYKGAIKAALTEIGKDPLARFVGYGMIAGRAGGFLKDVPESSLSEFTVAEDLMVGAAMGMSLMGLRPVVTIERADFLWNCMSALASHLDKCEEISRREFVPSVIIRVVVGGKLRPLFTGATHVSDPSEAMKLILKMPVLVARDAYEVQEFWAEGYRRMREGLGNTMIFEYKDAY